MLAFCFGMYYIITMFVRVKSTPNSPRKSVQIVQSLRRGNNISQKIVRHIGIAMDDDELAKLKMLAESVRIKLESGAQQLIFSPEELHDISAKINNKQKSKIKGEEDTGQAKTGDYNTNLLDLVEEDRVVVGIHEVYGRLFDELGYHKIFKNPKRNQRLCNYFKHIVLARIADPKSKRASVEMLEETFGVSLNLDMVYKMMDALDDTVIEKLNKFSYNHTLDLFQKKLDVIFFDCTTLYFESFSEDDFRKNGYSKDLKFNQPQVLLALMVTKEGLPIGYQAFDGGKYEGHTLLPALKELKEKYKIDKTVFVADAGMFNSDNLSSMEAEKGIEYIVGCRLKSLPASLKNEILNLDNYESIAEGFKIGRFAYKGRKLIISFSGKRARKDFHDREKAIKKLKEKLSKVKSPKAFLSNYGYKKFLKAEGETRFELDEEKILAASQWDGLHGVVTNSKELSNEEVIKYYRDLWNVEYAFRVTKNDLRIRPIFHWKEERIKAHLAISYTAFSLVKFLEYRIKLQYKQLSPEKLRSTLLRVQKSILFDKKKKIRFSFPSKVSQDAKKIYQLMQIKPPETTIIKKL